MITFERKKINNKPFYYLSEQIKVGEKYKKIQVFVGKNIPKNTKKFYELLKKKEEALIKGQIKSGQFLSNYVDNTTVTRLEKSRIKWKYCVTQFSKAKYELFIRDFAMKFIFESNAIEGSKLAQKVVSAIIKKKYVSKRLPKKEIQEVYNSIEAFNFIRSRSFVLNQKRIKELHSIVTKDLDVKQGFKKKLIVVNNKETTSPENVRKELTELINWYKRSKKEENPFMRAVIFHNRFELIHPFEDGNGRTGRLILNWMLMQDGYGVILIKNRNREAYMRALNIGDQGRYQNISRFCIGAYTRTIREIV